MDEIILFAEFTELELGVGFTELGGVTVEFAEYVPDDQLFLEFEEEN